MDRPKPSRPRHVRSSDIQRRDREASWLTPRLITGAAALGFFTLAGIVAYRYLLIGAPPKKVRSKHSKKDRKKKQADDEKEEPNLRRSGTTSPLSRSRPATPAAPTKAVADSSRVDQLAWWAEIAKDQFEQRQLDHAKYYAMKAMEIGSTIADFTETLTYFQLRYILVIEEKRPDARVKELQTIREGLARLQATEGGQKTYQLLKGRVLATLSDTLVREQRWKEAEDVCAETVEAMSKSFEGQDAMLATNLGVNYYQLAAVKRGLKKYEEAAECSLLAYESIVKSKLAMDFWSQVARQRADLLDVLGRFDEAKQVIEDHLERIEARHEAAVVERAQAQAKRKAKAERAAERIANGQEPEDEEDEEDDDDDEDENAAYNEQVASQGADAASLKHSTNIADNYMFLARLHFEHGEYERCIELLQKAHAMVPNFHYLSLLACAQFEAGLNKEAVATQTQIKKMRGYGELPISTSRTMLTKAHYLRQVSKKEAKWVFCIKLENKRVTPLSEEGRLPIGAYLEVFVRQHTSPVDDSSASDAAGAASYASVVAPSYASVASAGTKPKNRSFGPYTYVVTGDEKDNTLEIKGLLPGSIEARSVYEIVVYAYPNGEKASRIATHRQMARATDAVSALLGISSASALRSAEDMEEDIDSYSLPETSTGDAEDEEEVEETKSEGEKVEEINADSQASSSAPKEVTEETTEQKKDDSAEEKKEEVVAEEKKEVVEEKTEEKVEDALVAHNKAEEEAAIAEKMSEEPATGVIVVESQEEEAEPVVVASQTEEALADPTPGEAYGDEEEKEDSEPKPSVVEVTTEEAFAEPTPAESFSAEHSE